MFCLFPLNKALLLLPDQYILVTDLLPPDPVYLYDPLFLYQIIGVFSLHNHVMSCLLASIMVIYHSFSLSSTIKSFSNIYSCFTNYMEISDSGYFYRVR